MHVGKWLFERMRSLGTWCLRKKHLNFWVGFSGSLPKVHGRKEVCVSLSRTQLQLLSRQTVCTSTLPSHRTQDIMCHEDEEQVHSKEDWPVVCSCQISNGVPLRQGQSDPEG